ncbi:MAG TPA: HTTM domain-containing protein [Gemmatimonadales bacterium]|jgi:hypothetical protein
MIERWEAYWFPTAPTRNLAICRIVAVAAQLFLFYPSLEEHVNLLRKNSEFIEPQIMVRAISALLPREVVFTPSAVTALYWITAIAGAAALIGLFTRISLLLFALGTWFFVSHLFSYGDRHHTEAVFCIFLMLLALSPSGEELSVDAVLRRRRGKPARYPSGNADTAIWPLKLVHVLLALTYFSAGMSKLIASGPRWLNGYTLQNHAFQDAFNRGFPVGIWVAQHHGVALFLSYVTIFYEVFFFLSLLFPRTAPLFFLGGIGFHIGLYLTGGYDFFQHMVLLALLLVFLAPPWWRAWLNRSWAVFRSREPAEVRS